jgi:squalene-hopene/tetraprenyl-beta-curcumene cyclase
MILSRLPSSRRGMSLAIAFLISSCAFQGAANGALPNAPDNLSLRNEVQHAIDRGLAWLEKNQDPKGFWSTADQPAITALVLVAFQGSPDGAAAAKNKPALKKGYEFILSCVKPDGGIYKTNMANYNTALSLMALVTSKNEEYHATALKARQFLIGLQSDFDEPGKLDSPFDGGIGYGSRYKHSDMSNTLLALEALYYSKHLVKDQALDGARDLNWQAAIHFIQSCQNLPSHNKEKWASDDPQNKGGFIYYPGNSMAGETNLASGRTALRSYGSISYAGLLSYLYADLKQSDPRVQAVMDWLQHNYTLDENPGMGPQGLYYYYHTMAKALAISGVDRLKTTGGKTVEWRKELALRLINLQQGNGSWVNDNGRWLEKDPELVTSYSVIALEMLHRGL